MTRPTPTVMRNWTGQIDTGEAYIQDATPPARMEYLIGADATVLAAGMTYAQPALMFEGFSTNRETHRVLLVTPPAAKQARAYITQFGALDGAPQTDTTIDTTSSGSLGTTYDLAVDLDTITVPSEAVGTAVYGDTSGLAQSRVYLSGDLIDNSPAATANRQIELAEDMVRQLEVVEVRYCSGFGLRVTVRSADLEAV